LRIFIVLSRKHVPIFSEMPVLRRMPRSARPENKKASQPLSSKRSLTPLPRATPARPCEIKFYQFQHAPAKSNFLSLLPRATPARPSACPWTCRTQSRHWSSRIKTSVFTDRTRMRNTLLVISVLFPAARAGPSATVETVCGTAYRRCEARCRRRHRRWANCPFAPLRHGRRRTARSSATASRAAG